MVSTRDAQPTARRVPPPAVDAARRRPPPPIKSSSPVKFFVGGLTRSTHVREIYSAFASYRVVRH